MPSWTEILICSGISLGFLVVLIVFAIAYEDLKYFHLKKDFNILPGQEYYPDDKKFPWSIPLLIKRLAYCLWLFFKGR